MTITQKWAGVLCDRKVRLESWISKTKIEIGLSSKGVELDIGMLDKILWFRTILGVPETEYRTEDLFNDNDVNQPSLIQLVIHEH